MVMAHLVSDIDFYDDVRCRREPYISMVMLLLLTAIELYLGMYGDGSSDESHRFLWRWLISGEPYNICINSFENA
jgi:hypothetical protein